MTGRELTDAAYAILGLYGGSPKSDTDDYEESALKLINLLLAEISPIDCRIRRTEPKILSLDSLGSVIEASDITVSGVLPYGLASLFALGEDDSLYLSLLEKYNTAKQNALKFGRAKAEPITEVYE